MGNNVVRSFYDPKHAPLLKIGGAVYNLIFCQILLGKVN